MEAQYGKDFERLDLDNFQFLIDNHGTPNDTTSEGQLTPEHVDLTSVESMLKLFGA